MRVFVLVEPKFFTPPEMFPILLDGFAAWRDAHREQMVSFEFFAGRGGGFGILNVPDEAALNRIMVQYPFTPYSEITIRPIPDGDTALGQWRENHARDDERGPWSGVESIGDHQLSTQLTGPGLPLAPAITLLCENVPFGRCLNPCSLPKVP